MSTTRIILLFITIVIISITALHQLKIDLLPRVNNTSFVISYDLPNSSPAIVEQQITSKLENAFSKLTDLKHINAVSYFCSSIQQFVRRFLQIPPRGGRPCFGLTIPVGWLVQDLHFKELWHAWRTKKRG